MSTLLTEIENEAIALLAVAMNKPINRVTAWWPAAPQDVKDKALKDAEYERSFAALEAKLNMVGGLRKLPA